MGQSDRISDRSEKISLQIIDNAKNELYMGMRYLSLALFALKPVVNTELEGFATDGSILAVHPHILADLFEENRLRINRVYLHIVLHCLLRHLWNRKSRERRLWDLSCDIAVEAVIDRLRVRCVRMAVPRIRMDTYAALEKEIKVLTAEGIYYTLLGTDLSDSQMERLEEAFRADEHVLWPGQEQPQPDLPDAAPNHPLKGVWDEIAQKTQTRMETLGALAGDAEDELVRHIRIENRERYDYRGFLRKFAVWREHMAVDPDQFDYIYYTYGLSHYGNMPLIEPQEAKEDKRIEDFAIVLDVSLSTGGSLVKNFLKQTYTVLSERESYFRKVNIRIIQCDDRIRDDIKITSPEMMEEYMRGFKLRGGGGTDFRPAFDYVRELSEKGEFTDLRGMIYFTDGRGIYPVKPPPWECAFVFMEDDFTDIALPPWAVRLVIDKEQLEEKPALRTDIRFIW